MSEVDIRAARVNDLPKLAQLFDAYRVFYELPSDIDLSSCFIEDRLRKSDAELLVAVTPLGKLIGFCQLYPSFCSLAAAPVFVLYDLYVDPTARQSGAGTALLRAAHDLAKTQGKVRLDLTTAKNNLKAQSVYESLGWQRDEIFYAYQKAVA